MVAYSFKPRFVAPILAGAKRQTIRADRKRHARQGERLQLYTGMRTRSCKAIGTAHCLGADPITLRFKLWPYVYLPWGGYDDPDTLRAFAMADGFPDWEAMTDFWRETHPDVPVFSGVLIRWSEFRAAEA